MQFHLRSLLIVATVACVMLALIGNGVTFAIPVAVPLAVLLWELIRGGS
jgi:hypothetical protein